METNFEHYKDEMLKILIAGDKCKFFNENILPHDCKIEPFYNCIQCRALVKEWLDKPYVEPQIEIDWSKVPVDTPVIVKLALNGRTAKRHFAKYEPSEDNPFYCFYEGYSSWTNESKKLIPWAYCELARPEDVEKYKK